MLGLLTNIHTVQQLQQFLQVRSTLEKSLLDAWKAQTRATYLTAAFDHRLRLTIRDTY